MRIRIVQKPGMASIDGVRLDRFRPGQTYEVGTTLASLLLAEGWGTPVGHTDEPSVGPLPRPPNLTRELFPFSQPPALAAHRPPRRRRK
jgi:hypothetical protein